MRVFALVRHSQHRRLRSRRPVVALLRDAARRRLIPRTIHQFRLLPRRTSSLRAPIIRPRVSRPFDIFLTVFPPSVPVRVGDGAASRRARRRPSSLLRHHRVRRVRRVRRLVRVHRLRAVPSSRRHDSVPFLSVRFDRSFDRPPFLSFPRHFSSQRALSDPTTDGWMCVAFASREDRWRRCTERRAMDRSSFPLLPLSSRRRVLVVESSSSRSRARRRHRARTHQSIQSIPRAVGRSRSVARSRSWADDAGCVSSRDASIDPSIDRTDRTIGARAGRDGTGRRRARGWVSERPVGLSVGRLNDGHADGRERK